VAISFPRTDIFAPYYFSAQSFRLVSRQETSTQASGVVRGKDLGSALWVGDWTTIVLTNADAVAFEAKLNSLDGAILPFTAGDVRNPYPRLYADGVFTDSGTLYSVATDNKTITLGGLASGFTVSAGDYLSFAYGTSQALHQVVETAVAATGFEVRPHIRPGFTTGAAVTLKRPTANFTLLPGSVQTQSQGPVDSVVSFKAIQYL
jgi:hypothetical protein